jgi:hypothetical protein
MKELIKKIPAVGQFARELYWRLASPRRPPQVFRGSRNYWEGRYATGGNSGVGSYGQFAEFKAEVINAFVADRNIKSVIEFGCGDGNQLTLAKYSSYLGIDVSESAVQRCRKVFEADPTKSFEVIDNYKGQKADLALSLDVIYHVVEDSAFEQYLRTLFAAAERYVIIYSSDSANNRGFGNTYIKHRNFSQTVQREFPNWNLLQRIPNKYRWRGDYKTGSFCDFFIYERS